ncbi:peptidoglycan-binding protein [Polymorphum gilvum]|uniref:Sel1 repeat family n=1 Tax=Polymorphum gilvum (strain LMG 25793 / CGMCC 1.9160 / SL003B-26A1) TaxID=991905 RepID=F2IXN8_POLGS|nr:peptidoglycan-binding protein [Polymorphum gilvum]ADZ71661.1 Sel1 repeat family [Polymorphum gilvum SL003B-26A1]
MSSWNFRKAGRGGGDGTRSSGYRREEAWDDVDEGHAPRRSSRREAPRDRVERLTRTATAVGGYRDEPAWDLETEDELEAVADELDRLMGERQQRSRRYPDRAGPAPDRSGARRPHADRDPDTRSGRRDDDVLYALERLDQQVEDLVGINADDAPGSVRSTGRRSGRREPSRRESDWHDQRDDGDRGAADDIRARRDALDRLYEPDLDALDEMPEPPRRSRGGPARDEASRHYYRDLSRRIDALRRPQEEALDVVRREIGALRETLGEIPPRREDRDRKELRRLADMVERLRADRGDERLAREVRAEIAELKALVGHSNVDGTLKSLEHGYAHIVQRLDELSRASVDPRVVKTLGVRLVEIEESLSVLPRSEHLLVLEDRVADIAERMETLLRGQGREEIEPLRQELRDVRRIVEQVDVAGLIGGIDERIRFVADRLDEVEQLAREQRGLDSRLTAMEDRLPDAEALDRLNGRLEQIFGMLSDERGRGGLDDARLGQVDSRLDAIMGRLDDMERVQAVQPSYDAAFAVLERRLDGISTKIDTIEEKASAPAPVMLSGEGGIESELLVHLERQIADLGKRLAAPAASVSAADLEALRREIGEMREAVRAPAPAMSDLENRIKDLAEAVSRGGDGFDDGRLEQLGAKIGALASQIEAAEERLAGVAGIEKALARIEDGLRATREDVVGVAEKAARRAVMEHAPDGHDYDTAIHSLRDDLKRLLDAANGSEKRTRNTFEGVQSILGSITDRLDTLERGDLLRGGGRAEIQRTETEAGTALRLRPGPGETDARPRERVRDRKADFIAAARRAAQAASAEVRQSREDAPAEEDVTTSRTRTGWLRKALRRDKADAAVADETLDLADAQVLSEGPEPTRDEVADIAPEDRPAPEQAGRGWLRGGRRRALLLAAAAVVLAIGTLQVFKLATTGDDLAALDGTGEPATVADTPVADTAPAEADIAAAPQAGGRQNGAETQAVAETPPFPPAAGAGTLSQEGGEAPPAVAFAPPAGVAGNFAGGFGERSATAGSGDLAGADDGVPRPASARAPLDPPAAGPAGGDVIAGLPPEEIGPMALRSAAASGNPAAEFQVAVNYTEGRGVAADLSEAAKWYERAALQGLAPAQYRLASLYEKGRGVTKDLAKAREWYTRAAQAGNAKAMHNLAVLHAEGADGQPDFEQAARWFTAAADYGIPDSLFNLGILHARGLGVTKDLGESYKWFAVAARQGDRDAAKKRDEVANMLDKDQLAAARLAVDSFKLKDPDPKANTVALDPSWESAGTAATRASAVSEVDMILQAQHLLKTLGFDPGTADGRMGPKTRTAIEEFQRSIDMPATGVVDADLIKALLGRSI